MPSSESAYSTEEVSLDGTGSSDSEGGIARYSWSQASGPAISITGADSGVAAFTVPRLDSPAEIVIELEVSDDDGATHMTSAGIQVAAAPVQFAAEITGGSPYVDESPVSLTVGDATLNGDTVTPVSLEWDSSLEGILASAVALNQIVDVTLGHGEHTLTLTGDFGDLGVVRYSEAIKVLPRTLEIPSYLSTPAAGYQVSMPVVLVTHIPTQDGVTLDLAEANYAYRPPEWTNNSVDDLITYINTINLRKKFTLEEMTRFRGYKALGNSPYLGYEVVEHYIFYEALPLSTRTNPFDMSQQMVDFAALMARIDGASWVDNESVREFWFNNYFNDKFQFWESNMSSPTSDDISNSDRDSGDLPVYSQTYIVYGTNYHRTQAEAIHNHGHQLEAMLDYVDRLHSGTSDLFWGKFVGVPNFPGPSMMPGRCGWTHQPPNTTVDYGYSDQTVVEVDCEDWRPDGTGAKVPVNSDYFDSLSYAWPDGNIDIPQRAETQFYIWWGQNMPGQDNNVPYNTTTIENWWKFTGDWDAAITNQTKLYK
jgi:hypothetical protein